MNNPRKELEREILSVRGEMNELDVGSEEYLNACKASNQLAEASQKLKRVDFNQMIPGIASIGMFVIYMAFSDTRIVDTRGIQFVRGLFKK